MIKASQPNTSLFTFPLNRERLVFHALTEQNEEFLGVLVFSAGE
jgi:hypothetical protein